MSAQLLAAPCCKLITSTDIFLSPTSTHCIVSLCLVLTQVAEMTMICTYVRVVAGSVVLQTNHLDRHLFEPCLPPPVPPRWLLGMPAVCTASPDFFDTLLLSTLLCALCTGAVLFWPELEYFPAKSWYFPSSLSPPPDTNLSNPQAPIMAPVSQKKVWI